MNLNLGGRVKGALLGGVTAGLVGLVLAPFTFGTSMGWALAGAAAGIFMPEVTSGAAGGVFSGGSSGTLWGGLGGAVLGGIVGFMIPFAGNDYFRGSTWRRTRRCCWRCHRRRDWWYRRGSRRIN